MQQVNLYLPEFRPKFDPFSTRPLGVFIALMIVVLSVWSWRLQGQIAAQQQQEDALKTQVSQSETKIANLKRLTKPVDKTQMEAALAAVQLAIQNREFAKQLIAAKQGNQGGFSMAVKAVAQASIDDVMLQSFALENGGKSLRLAGIARRVDAAPEYLQRVKSQPVFKDTAFGVVSLEKTSKPGEIQFSIGFPLEDAAKPGAAAKPHTAQAGQAGANLPVTLVPMTPVGAVLKTLGPGAVPQGGAKP